MFKFQSSAPGKVILFGEHAVVYGTTAVAAALSDLRIVVDMGLTEVSSGVEPTLEATLHDIPSPSDESQPYTGTLLLSRIRELIGERHKDPLSACNPSDKCIALLRAEFGDAPISAAQGLMAICYLAARVIPEIVYDEGVFPDDSVSCNGSPQLIKKHYGIKINVRSRGLPLGAGLGSSAAFSVALAGVLLQTRKCMFVNNAHPIFIDDDNNASTPPLRLLPILNAWAFAAEVLIHGAPSGLDNTTSCYGGAVKYGNLLSSRFESLAQLPQMNILLTNTKVPGRSTKLLVSGVRRNHDAMPDVIKPIIAAIEGISNKFLSLLMENDKISRSSFLEQVGTLMSMNHDLLNALGVGHPALTAVREASRSISCQCKLTGAGGGGCAITLLPEVGAEDCVLQLNATLSKLGFDTFQSSIGGHGVQWH